MGRCKRDTTGIMIASNKTIVICNVQPYGWGVGYGEGGWEKVLCFLFKKILSSFMLKGELQRQNKLISSERPFTIQQNETKIIKIGQAVLEIFKFKD